MSEKTLLRRIVPAVAPAGHGLDELSVLQLLYKGVAGIMAALVAVDYRFVIQSAAVLGDELVGGFQDEIHFLA